MNRTRVESWWGDGVMETILNDLSFLLFFNKKITYKRRYLAFSWWWWWWRLSVGPDDELMGFEIGIGLFWFEFF